MCSEVALIETQRRASAPVTAHLPLTSPCRPTAQLGQQRNLCDPNRQLLTPENANEPGSSALACVRWKSTDTSICLVRGRKEGTGGRGGGGRREWSGSGRGRTEWANWRDSVIHILSAMQFTSVFIEIIFLTLVFIDARRKHFHFVMFSSTCTRAVVELCSCRTLAVLCESPFITHSHTHI